MTRRLDRCLCLNDFEREARRVLPRPIFGYVHAAAEDRRAFEANYRSFDKYALVPRVLVDATGHHARTALLGQEYGQPFGMAPVGLSALYTYRGDVELARVAAERNIPMVMSSSSLIPMEEVARAHPGAWFQAYLPGDREKMEALVQRILRAGFKTLVLTVDTPANPNKEAYIRSGFTSPLQLSAGLLWQGITHPGWSLGTFLKTLLRHGIPHFENNYATRGVPIIASNVERSFADRSNLGWDHFARVREMWPHQLVVKGVLSPQDALRARELGADGVILSNHGGRQLDSAVAPLAVLPEAVRLCPGFPVMVDGGIRRGTDVLKALALGAAFVFVGRPFAYAAATAGRAGMEKVVDLLAAEIDRSLVMLGVRSTAELTPDCLAEAS
ncbi:MAG: alpha-hydroxy acid oxidase [Pseudomonadota bacterium]